MSLKSAALKLSAAATVAPPYTANLSGALTLGQSLEPSQAAATNVFQFRAYFGAGAQSAVVDLTDGSITLSSSGTRQVETCTVTAASGATSGGDLALTLTSALVSGSPLAITVPLSTTAHTTAALIAGAIVAKLKTLSAVTDHFRITQSGDAVVLTSIFGLANDTTLNLAITAGLGVSAVTTSTNTTSGAAGAIIERIGSDGEDVHGAPLTSVAALTTLLVSSLPQSAGLVTVNDAAVNINGYQVYPGGFACVASPTPQLHFADNTNEVQLTNMSGKNIVDFLAIGSAS